MTKMPHAGGVAAVRFAAVVTSMLTAAACAADAGGNIYVTDAGNHRIQVFDAAGGFVRSLGRRGEGPGEFGQPISTTIAADRLVIADRGPLRLSFWSLDGHGHLYVYLFVFQPYDPDKPTEIPDQVPVDVYSPGGERLFSGLIPSYGRMPNGWGDAIRGSRSERARRTQPVSRATGRAPLVS